MTKPWIPCSSGCRCACVHGFVCMSAHTRGRVHTRGQVCTDMLWRPPAAGGPRAHAAHRLALCPAPGPPQRGHCEVVGVLTVSNLRLLDQGLQFPLGDVFHTLPMGGGLQQPGPGWRRSPALRAAAVTHPRTWGRAAGLLGAGPAPPGGAAGWASRSGPGCSLPPAPRGCPCTHTARLWRPPGTRVARAADSAQRA